MLAAAGGRAHGAAHAQFGRGLRLKTGLWFCFRFCFRFRFRFRSVFVCACSLCLGVAVSAGVIAPSL